MADKEVFLKKTLISAVTRNQTVYIEVQQTYMCPIQADLFLEIVKKTANNAVFLDVYFTKNFVIFPKYVIINCPFFVGLNCYSLHCHAAQNFVILF